jgi:hypothetical protein
VHFVGFYYKNYLSPVSPNLDCDVSTPPSPIDAVVVAGTVVPARPIEVVVLVVEENNGCFVNPNPNSPPPAVDVVVPPRVKLAP